MTSLTFLDTNIFLRIILDDHIEHSPRARNLLDRVARGHEEVITSESAVAETVFTLTGKRLAMPRLEVADAVLNILSMDGVHLDTKSIISAAFGRFVTVARLSFADCLHAAQAAVLTGGRIYTFDQGFDRLPGLTRLEPT